MFVLFAAIAIAAGSSVLVAPTASAQEVPSIEPTYTKVFGAQSTYIKNAALSPDGRWIAFTEGDDVDRTNLWVVSAEGGKPIRLTRGPYLDGSPVWFPTSDRIAFRSTRPPTWAIMTLPLDPLTGKPTGPPQQVTIERLTADFDVSPDGKWIAYTTSGPKGLALRVLPATGGIARTVAEPAGLSPVWSSDGRNIYYVTGRADSSIRKLMRAPVEGGRPETMSTWADSIRLLPNAELVLRRIRPRPGEPRVLEIATMEGLSLGRLDLPEGMGVVEISRDGDEILAIMRDWVAPLTILPVKGGPGRRLNEAMAHDEPLGWSPDSKKVLFETELNGDTVMLFAPVDGGPMHQVKLPEPRMRAFRPVLSGDGNHLLYAADGEGRDTSTLKVYSLEEDWSWALTRSHTFVRGHMRISGVGGTEHRDGNHFLYFEKREGRYELYASPPRGPSRLLKAFAADRLPKSTGVHGDRIAFTESQGRESSLLLATRGKAAVRRILKLNGMLDMVLWSPDGRWLAAYHFDRALSPDDWESEGRNLLIVEVSSSGEATGEPRTFRVPPGHWWSPRWLPDSRGIVTVGVDGNVWLIPLDPSARPVALTQDDPNSVWRYSLSPDGRTIAYSSEMPTGSSIWRVQPGEAMAAAIRQAVRGSR